MADLFYNDFSQGIISPKMGGRTNSTAYHNGVSVMENFIPMVQGGFKRRAGTVLATSDDMTGVVRAIPFILSSSEVYVLLLGAGKLKMLDTETRTVVIIYDIPYSDLEIRRIQYTQDYETVYLMHPSYEPRMLTRVTSGQFSFGTMAITACSNADYPDLNVAFGGQNNPSGGRYYQSRLWLASSLSHPFKFWGSEPFRPTSFLTYDMVEVVDEVASADAYADAIKNGTDVPASTTKLKQVISADNAIVLELGGNRNDKIMWMGAVGGYIVLGTASSEWVIPGTIDAQNQSSALVSSFGSADMQCVLANDCIIFVQQGGKKVRAYRYGSSGVSCQDLTFQSDDILAAGVKEIEWQRVPEPRLYCVLNDGTVAVLCYDVTYSMMAWSKLSITGSVLSLCVVDTEDGQDVYLLTERNGVRRLEMLDDSSTIHSDLHDTLSPIEFTSKMVTERLEPTGSSIGKVKRISKARIRVLDSGQFDFGYDRNMRQHDAITEGEAEILLPGGYDKDLKLTVTSVGDQPLCLLAMALETTEGK